MDHLSDQLRRIEPTAAALEILEYLDALKKGAASVPPAQPHSPASHNSEATPATGTAIKIATPQNRAAGESLVEGLMISSIHPPRRSWRYPEAALGMTPG
jgi:hypothetical protein